MFLDRRVALPAVFQANEIICMRNPAVLSPCLLKATQKLIEDQIAALNIAKDDALLSKYNLEAIVKFMKEKFANLGTTYKMSNLSQLRVLLCSITPSGMMWSYPGLSNTQISPIYQQIRMFDDMGIGSSAAGESRTLTPLLTGALKAPVSAIPPPRLVDFCFDST